jgi:hypothetical protein
MAVEEGSDASAAAALAGHSHQDYPQRHQETKRRPVEQRVQPELERHSRCHLEEKGKQPVRSVKTEGLFVFPSQHMAQSESEPEIRVLLEDLKTEAGNGALLNLPPEDGCWSCCGSRRDYSPWSSMRHWMARGVKEARGLRTQGGAFFSLAASVLTNSRPPLLRSKAQIRTLVACTKQWQE